MTVTPPGVGPILADLADLAALSLLTGGPEPPTTARPADSLALGPPPTVLALQDLAKAGLQQLGSLLPTLERVVRSEIAEPAPLGHLARAVGDAAYRIGAGCEALSLTAEPGRDIAQAWQHGARDALHDASDLLTRAEQRLDPSPQAPLPSANPEALWALSQLVGAQHQVAGALGKLSFRSTAAAPVAGRIRADLPGAIAILGLVLVLTLYAAVFGTWLIAAGLAAAIALAAAIVQGWRGAVSARGLRLELRHGRSSRRDSGSEAK